MQLDFHVLDVFTATRGAGNPLAVVMHADQLTDGQMQRIAREFNLSETVFVVRPHLDSFKVSVRIFTPERELEFAGHPTVGTAALFGLLEGLNGIRLEEQIGVVTCVIDKISKNVAMAQFGLPKLPQEIGTPPGTALIAQSLGIDAADIGFGGMAPRGYSAGLGFTLVPVRNADVLAQIKPERRGWDDVFPDEIRSVYAFCATPDEADNDYAARMFGPGIPGGEDPATGSAAAALIGLLVAVDPDRDTKRVLTVRQGREMGRPSQIRLHYTISEGKLVHAGIGGEAVLVRSGKLEPD